MTNPTKMIKITCYYCKQDFEEDAEEIRKTASEVVYRDNNPAQQTYLVTCPHCATKNSVKLPLTSE